LRSVVKHPEAGIGSELSDRFVIGWLSEHVDGDDAYKAVSLFRVNQGSEGMRGYIERLLVDINKYRFTTEEGDGFRGGSKGKRGQRDLLARP
jgi:hypothetical protein